MRPPERVLIVRLSSIGDVVHTLPAFMELRRAWPDARFGWAVEPAAATLVDALDVDSHLVPTPELRRRPLSPSSWRRVARLRRELRETGYDLAIDFQGLLKSAVVARLSGAPTLGYPAGSARESLAARLYTRTCPPIDAGVHVVERARSLAAAATGEEPGPIAYPRLFSHEQGQSVRRRIVELGLGDYILVHTAANWDSKRYPDERWIAAGREIHRRTGLPVLWIWGPGEQERTRRLAEAAGDGNRPSFATTLPELAALIEGATLLLGGDSAPLHVAVACGTPVVGLFGPTDPALLGPLDPNDEVVRNFLPCSHCHRRTCPLGTRECLVDLPHTSIVRAVESRLRSGRPR